MRYLISHEITKSINKQHSNKKSNNSIPKKQINNIIKKIQDKNLTVNKSDKGNILTIENKNILDQKTIHFLDNPLYKKLKTDPTQKYQNEIKNIIKQSSSIINNKTNKLINPIL